MTRPAAISHAISCRRPGPVSIDTPVIRMPRVMSSSREAGVQVAAGSTRATTSACWPTTATAFQTISGGGRLLPSCRNRGSVVTVPVGPRLIRHLSGPSASRSTTAAAAAGPTATGRPPAGSVRSSLVARAGSSGIASRAEPVGTAGIVGICTSQR